MKCLCGYEGKESKMLEKPMTMRKSMATIICPYCKKSTMFVKKYQLALERPFSLECGFCRMTGPRAETVEEAYTTWHEMMDLAGREKEFVEKNQDGDQNEKVL